MIIYRQRLFSRARRFRNGIQSTGHNVLNHFTPAENITKIGKDGIDRLRGLSCFVGRNNENMIGVDLAKLKNSAYRLTKEDLERNPELVRSLKIGRPRCKGSRSGVGKQVGKGYISDGIGSDKISTIDSAITNKGEQRKLARIDLLNSEVANHPRKYKGMDVGEVRFNVKNGKGVLGKDALISVPKDSSFERRVVNINGEDITVTDSNVKKLRKYLKSHKDKVNSSSRETLEFILGNKNPNIESILKNSKPLKEEGVSLGNRIINYINR